MAKRPRTIVRDPRKVAAEKNKVLTFGDEYDHWSITESQLNKVKKQLRGDIAYMKRHGVPVDEQFLPLTDERIALRWNARYTSLDKFIDASPEVQERERVKAVSAWFVFPEGMSRARIAAIGTMAENTNQDVTFADILRGDVSWEEVEAYEEELKAQGIPSKNRAFAISQRFFGSP